MKCDIAFLLGMYIIIFTVVFLYVNTEVENTPIYSNAQYAKSTLIQGAGYGNTTQPLVADEEQNQTITPNECNNFTDCPEGHACMRLQGNDYNQCIPEDCKTNSDCRSDEGCRQFMTYGNVQQFTKLCVPFGRAKEGEACSIMRHINDDTQCGKGLECISFACRRSCDADNDCRDEEHCAKTYEGLMICRKDCIECDEGMFCHPVLTLGECLPFSGVDCISQPESCEGKCLTEQTSSKEIIFKCLQPCHPFIENSCPEDSICDGLSQVCRKISKGKT